MDSSVSTGMRREIGPWGAYALVAGTMIGTGIYFFVSPVASRVGSTASILAVWASGTLIAAAGAACVSELAATYPRTGGIYVFLQRAYGPLTAYLYSWSKFLIMRVGSLGVATLAFADFTFRALGLEPTGHHITRTATALAALWVVTIVNGVGVRSAAHAQIGLTVVKVLALFALIGLALAFAAGVLGAHTRVPIATPPPSSPAATGYGLALITVMWTLGGWDESPFVAEEVRDPARNLPLSVLGGLISVGVLFVLVNAAYLLVFTPDELAASGTRTATLFVERTLGEGAGCVLAVVLMISTLGSANGLTLTGARIAFAVGRDTPLLCSLAVVSPRAGTPNRALVAQACLASVAICALANPFELLLYTAVAYWGFAALTAFAVIILRRKDPHAARPFKVACYPALPLLFTAAAAAMAIAVGIERPRTAAINLMLIAAGALTFRTRSRDGQGQPR